MSNYENPQRRSLFLVQHLSLVASEYKVSKSRFRARVCAAQEEEKSNWDWELFPILLCSETAALNVAVSKALRSRLAYIARAAIQVVASLTCRRSKG